MVGKVLLKGVVAGLALGLATLAPFVLEGSTRVPELIHILVASAAFWTITIWLLLGVYTLSARLLYSRKGK